MKSQERKPVNQAKRVAQTHRTHTNQIPDVKSHLKTPAARAPRVAVKQSHQR